MDFELLFNVKIKGDGCKSGQKTRSSTNSSLGTSETTPRPRDKPLLKPQPKPHQHWSLELRTSLAGVGTVRY